MEELLEIAKKVSVKLTEREETVSVIESSSGGLISSSLLAQPGASAYYIGGQVVYTAKSIRGVTGLRLRDLKEKNIRSSSEPFALLLGEKGVEMYSTDWCITETGAAGPSRWPCCSCCLLYTSPSPRDQRGSRMPSSA